MRHNTSTSTAIIAMRTALAVTAMTIISVLLVSALLDAVFPDDSVANGIEVVTCKRKYKNILMVLIQQ